MRRRQAAASACLVAVVALGFIANARQTPAGAGTYEALVSLFDEFLDFERPPLVDGAPDYTAATSARRREALRGVQARLAAIVPDDWPVDRQVDYALVQAQVRGFEFYLDVLQPWARDPAYYKSVWMSQSDTPEHEGPTHHAVVEVWTYPFPLSADDASRLAAQLRTIPPLLAQARGNLTGNARDLWITGAGTLRQQVADLDTLARRAAGARGELTAAMAGAREATVEFADWLDAEAPRRTGPSGIGKAAYTRSLQDVHLIPMTWDDEVALLKRELDRARAVPRAQGVSSGPAATRRSIWSRPPALRRPT